MRVKNCLAISSKKYFFQKKKFLFLMKQIDLALFNLISRTDDRKVSLTDEQLTCICFAIRYC